MRAVVVGVGTNLGAREAAIHAARGLLDARASIEIVAVSSMYETEPLGPPQGTFLNAAFRLETSRSPEDLLKELLRIERRLGRVRHDGTRWGPRSIDLDLLWDERGEHRSPSLVVPHPELIRRAFALVPLLEVAPEAGIAYENALRAMDGRPVPWARKALIERDSKLVTVEADSLSDACALCLPELDLPPRSWSTRHAVLRPSPEHLAEALRQLLRTGFLVTAITISHCSKTQWTTQFHGGNTGARFAHDVRLQTTSGDRRKVRACLFIDPTPRLEQIF